MMGMMLSGTIFGARQSISYRPSGYAVVNDNLLDFTPTGNDRSDPLDAKYCA